MRLLLKILVTTNLLCLAITANASANYLVLQGTTEKLFFLHNISANSIWLDHPTNKRGVSAGWSSYLHPDQWSAISVASSNFLISCTQLTSGKAKELDCNKVLKVSVSPTIKKDKKNKVGYWVVEDKIKNDFYPAVKKRVEFLN